MAKPGIQRVDSSPFGVYVWIVDGGGMLVDEEQRPLSIAAQKGDLRRMVQLQQAAASYGFPEGKPHFVSGARKISDNEWEYQVEREQNGLLADEYDVGALVDEVKFNKENN